MSYIVLVLGASDKSERYSNKAMHLLALHGFRPIGVNPRLSIIDQMPCYASLAAANKAVGPIDTVTVYLSPELSGGLLSEISALKPRRVIFNPGSENPTLIQGLEAKGIEVEAACTLVLLNTKQF